MYPRNYCKYKQKINIVENSPKLFSSSFSSSCSIESTTSEWKYHPELTCQLSFSFFWITLILIHCRNQVQKFVGDK
jgi:hypothetical protein